MRTLLFVFAFALFFMPRAALALEGSWAQADHMQIRLLSGAESVGPSAEIQAALHVQLHEGWHTYWRTPGDSGLAPVFDWSGSENVESTELLWPIPRRFDEYGLQTFGYSGDFSFPVVLKLKQPGQDTVLKVEASVLVCKDICVPQTLEASLSIPAGEGKAAEALKAIEFAKTKVPVPENAAALKIENVTAGPEAIVIDAFSQKGFMSADVFVELKDGAVTSKPKITVDTQDQRKAQIVVAAPENIENFFDVVREQDVTVTLTNGHDAVERKIRF